MKGRRSFGFAAAIAPALLLLGPAPILAAESNPPAAADTPAESSPSSDGAKIRELQKKVDERDAIIRDLVRRVEKLEHEQAVHGGGGAAPSASAVTPNAKKTPPRQAGQEPAPVAAPQAPPAAPPKPASSTAQATPPAQPAPSAPSAPSEPPKPGPGQFEVSEEAAQHALERALVQTGAALLPFGTLEFVPSVTYQYQRFSLPGQIALTTGGAVLITENVTRSTQVQATALLRAGLPWDSQLEVGLPWDYKRISVVSRANGAGFGERAIGVQGLGDPTLSLIKQVLTESDVRPGVFLSGSWNANEGQVKQNLPLGQGFNEFFAGVTAVKRQDPLVFTGNLTYVNSLQHNGLKPGDQYIGSVAMLFAVSPETSLRVNQQILFGREATFRGRSLPGSDKTEGILSFGVLSILGRGLVVDFNAGIGETPDSPNFFVTVQFPIRLN